MSGRVGPKLLTINRFTMSECHSIEQMLTEEERCGPASGIGCSEL